MFESIYVGMTGLDSYAKGLNVISNNVANLNTTGFKGAQLQFADVYYHSNPNGGQAREQIGSGVTTSGTFLNFQQGEARDTGADLDAMVDGTGMFVLRQDGQTSYTRAGQFRIDDAGFLVDQTTGARVAGRDPAGSLTDLAITGRRASAPRPTTRITLNGNLSTADAQHVVSGLNVFDASGDSAAWTVTLDNSNAASAGSWSVTVTATDGTRVGTGELRFSSGRPAAGFDSLVLSRTLPDGSVQTVTLALGPDATNVAGAPDSTLVVSEQDGHPAGALVKTTFDEAGFLVLSYSNGESDRAGQLALAWFANPDALEQAGNNRFMAAAGQLPTLGVAGQGEFGKVTAGRIESSNVDLSQQFSEMIITQRGYQAASQVVTTTNEMIQQLLEMRGKR
jgi:flagellar hook protein FlgE